MVVTCFVFDIQFWSVNQIVRFTQGYLAIFGHLALRGFRIRSNLSTKIRVINLGRSERLATIFSATIGALLGLFGFALLPLGGSQNSTPTDLVRQVTPLSIIYSIVNYFCEEPLAVQERTGQSRVVSVLRYILYVFLSCWFVGRYGFGELEFSCLSDLLATSVCYIGIKNLLSKMSRPKSHISTKSKTFSQLNEKKYKGRSDHGESFFEDLSVMFKKLSGVIKTILDNQESRNIFFFLCLNLAYMVIQMMYGVWTNSLGLISDSIHMFFDCMALGMGLFASVMATWPPDEEFTHGYGRVQTLSGFANGIFLMLISIFIVIEAIQRLLNPPEMNTNKLLIVSFMGLVVNLVGMFCTGHHHHHHHGHSHSHDHDHHDARSSSSSSSSSSSWRR
ncbi:hypothetical protein BY996DRAFT_1545651 [Phakopsora pachyrhizi]|nr:hypothetical protein BY996DRAFT_1545651 [Phakopsora pachyrhizi]